MEVVYTCPLGHTCEEAKDNKVYRCRWYVKLRGTDPQTGEPVDEFRCSQEWAIIMNVENTQQVRQTGAAIESFRNEMVNQNANLLTGLQQASKNKLIKNED